MKLVTVISKTLTQLNTCQLLAVFFLLLAKILVICSIGLFITGIAKPTFLSYAGYTVTGAGVSLISCLYCGFHDLILGAKNE